MPLVVADLGAVDEDVLARARGGLLLLDLDLRDVGWVLHDLGDECTSRRQRS